DFVRRVDREFMYYEENRINYAQSIYHVGVKTSNVNRDASTAMIALDCPAADVEIRYTLDGTEPTVCSPLYSKPFAVRYPMNVNVASFRDNIRIGKVITKSIAVF